MLNIAAAASEHSVRRLIAVSTFGAGDSRSQVSFLPRTVVFGVILRSEVADKEAMESQLAATDLDWTVVRVGVLTDGPRTGVYRTRDDGTIRGMGRISRADVAHFFLNELQGSRWLRRRPVLMY
jgi:putative NADH-flavin reductase